MTPAQWAAGCATEGLVVWGQVSTNEESRLISLPVNHYVFPSVNYFILVFEKLILLSFVMVPLPTNLNLEIEEVTPVQHKPGAYMSAHSRGFCFGSGPALETCLF